jgi:DNA helicase-2/ATP-dependent DNA helicase PcrA
VSDPDETELDAEQLAAVTATERAIAVLAGPGSGKTRTLSHRARHLLRTDAGSRALLLTFTNKAAAEMKARAIDVAAVTSDRIDANTFHSFGVRVLRAHGPLIGVPRDFDILDETEAKEFAEGVAAAIGTSDRLREWQASRLRRRAPSDPVAAFGREYQSAKARDEVVDFDDLVVLTADLLQANEDLARAYGGRYSHLLVDEFQDTNAVQFDIVQALAEHAKTVSVFADDDQAIFGFVGADTANIRSFISRLGAREFPLTCNYRCRAEIVKRANSLIAANPGASGRQMRAHRDGGEATLRTYMSVEEEAASLSEEIEARLTTDTPGSIAVLVRSGYRANELVDALRRRRIPITDWRGDTFDRDERRAFATAMSVLRSRLSERRRRRLGELLGVDPSSDTTDTQTFLEASAGNPVADELLRLRALAFEGATPAALAAQAQTAIAQVDPGLAAGMTSLVETVADFEAHDAEFSIDDLLAELALGSGGRAPTHGGGVRVASLHKTKGLQWPTVYLLGFEEGHMPDYRAEDVDIPDERKACFVGVCRAEDELIMTFARRFRTHHRQPSRFVSELEQA